MRNIEKHLAVTEENTHKNVALCVQDLQNLCKIFGDEFSKPWQNEGVQHCNEDQVSYLFQVRIGRAFEDLYRAIQGEREHSKIVNDRLAIPFNERAYAKLNHIVNNAYSGKMSDHLVVDEWVPKRSNTSDQIKAKRKRHGHHLTIPYSFIPRIKKGIIFIDNKIVLKLWDEDRAVDGCTSEACWYWAMDRYKQWEERLGFVAYMEVEDGPTIAAIRETRDKACSAVRGKIRKETLKRMGLA
tara:strand:+ start:271 stop:993 length:723 start_codon:yes stop_codon:yes gene_type:complete